ncbi:hypothetical protein [Devosia sp. SD17-2]|uniref:hypothetical protein n=1 Tax=Devosia sp. SD17-2 TaxID=2976459 RepID=UPI0023D88859|nr:hypothetical protein [Devosia sp. SD17-2]WEJ31697.1 hypothetical protein NYQ88_12360 [Devosia sp. SD17-2]
MAAKLLRDAAGFFSTIGSQNADLKQQMDENSRVFERMAVLVERDPMEVLQTVRTSELAAKLLRDAATFFSAIGEQNPPLKIQMEENGIIFRQVADLVLHDPLGMITDGSDTASLRDPLAFLERSDAYRADGTGPQFGLSYPSAGQPRPLRVLSDSETDRRLAGSVNDRDDGICRYCGFRCELYQAAVGPAGAVTASQFFTTCGFCANVINLDRVSPAGAGWLVWLPELSQVDLNTWMRVIFVCRISQGRAADQANAALAAFTDRRRAAIEEVGTDDAGQFEQWLAGRASPEEYRAALNGAHGLRLLASGRQIVRDGELQFNRFPQILAYWRSKDGPFGSLLASHMDLSSLVAIADAVRSADGPVVAAP